VALAPKLQQAGITVRGVRLDSGDLIALSRSVRAILDAGGLQAVTIFASGGLDEDDLAVFATENAPIDGLGIGTAMTTSTDVPALDVVYKLQEYAGVPRRKRSASKATWPGRKQVWRRYDADGRMAGDILSLEASSRESAQKEHGEPLVRLVMQNGKRLAPAPSLDDIRRHSKREFERLPQPLQRLDPAAAYPVEVADVLHDLADAVDRRLLAQRAKGP
jgi:nicotinate phosphoribosyltransferase